MKIAIVGAGVAGSYLYRLLLNKGIHADLFDIEHKTACGINPCAWGTNAEFKSLVNNALGDYRPYVIKHINEILMDDIKTGCELYTINKPMLLRRLNSGDISIIESGDSVALSKYDRVIDATGVERALLPKIKNDMLLRCVQCRVARVEYEHECAIEYFWIGYSWRFPLGDGVYHLGCGSLIEDPIKKLELSGWLDAPAKVGNIRCDCSGKIRITSPYYSQPFYVKGENGAPDIIGVGEAIGIVASLAGDGIVPAMRSCQILMDNWDKPEEYSKRILTEFAWMKKERGVIDKMVNKKRLSIMDYKVLVDNAKRMGLNLSIKDSMKLIINKIKPF